MNKESLKKELQPYYQKGDCCSWIVELRKECSEKDKEIERLNKELEEYKKDYDRIYTENCKLREKHNITDISLLDENYRLNNIINELKKGLIKEIDSLQDVEVESKEDIRCRTLCDVLDKLSDLIGELKEGKDNE